MHWNFRFNRGIFLTQIAGKISNLGMPIESCKISAMSITQLFRHHFTYTMYYKIVRHFLLGAPESVKYGLSLEEAQAHCKNPETSYATCTSTEGKKRTEERGIWFDGYTEE